MKKYKYDALAVETTRKCNLRCVHCGRGEAQDVTITPEIIDAIFENVEACPKWHLLGGEPLLEMGVFEYFVDALTRSDVGAKTLSFTTNGSILNHDLIPLLAKFTESEEGREVHIRIFDDPFHDLEQSKKAFDFYCQGASAYKGICVVTIFNGELKKIRDNDLPFICSVMPTTISGRAIENVKIVKETAAFGIVPAQTYNHRIRIDDNTVKCGLAVYANGRLGFQEMQDYETIDKLAFGNILKTSMYDMIMKVNSECLLSCRDTQQFERMSAWKIPGFLDQEYPMMPFLNQLISMIGEHVFTKVLEAREAAHKRYPHIPTWEIIEAIPFPDFQFDGVDTVQKILAQLPPFALSDVMDNIDLDVLKQATSALAELKTDPIKDKIYNGSDSIIDALKCFGKLKEIEVGQSVIDALEPLNSQYEKEGKEAEEKNSACQETSSGAIESGSIKEIIMHSSRAAREHIYTEAGYELLQNSRWFAKKIMEQG